MEGTNLKPCPFCGGEAHIKTWRDRWGNWNARVYCINTNGKPIEEKCQAEFFMRSTTKEKVIEEITAKWNKRPNPWHTGTPPVEEIDEDNQYCYALCFYYDGWWLSDYLFKVNYEEGCFENSPNNGQKISRFKFCETIAWKKIEPYKENEDGHTD